MNLFWETRNLTQAREDHLTYFLAAALDADDAFRNRYGDRVLSPLNPSGEVPKIVGVETQCVFADERCRPDLLLRLADGRKVICEHKLDAPETPFETDEGEIRLQLERYLALAVDAVAYFRPALANLSREILEHPRYLHPPAFPHFLWRDLYDPLSHGEHAVTRWLFEGFRKLGFTPAVPHVGALWPDETEEGKENQRNFGKLWLKTQSHATPHWKVDRGRRCELYLLPHSPGLVTRVYVSPLAQGGSLLRFRAETTDGQQAAVQERFNKLSRGFPSPGK